MNNPSIKLNDGNVMPQLGFGMWQVPDKETEKLVNEAFKAGYRSIDCAQIYQNESGLGQAIRSSGLKREEIFITTKIWNSEQKYDSAIRSYDVSLKKLGLDSVDLLLIHWPAPKQGLFVEAWKALIDLKKQGRVKSIGVSNFNTDHLEKIIAETGVTPAVNQIELHPRFQRHNLRAFHSKHNIATESWSPLGQGHLLKEPVIAQIAVKHKKSTAQIIIRWHLEQGLMVIPKSVTPERIRENFDVFDFKLSADEMELMATIDDREGRIGPDPATADF